MAKRLFDRCVGQMRTFALHDDPATSRLAIPRSRAGTVSVNADQTVENTFVGKASLKRSTLSMPAAIGLPASAKVRRFKLASIATARIDENVLPRWISKVAIALRQIIAGSRRRLGTGDGTDRAASDRTGYSAARSAGDETAQ
jgi:hypothetical protein